MATNFGTQFAIIGFVGYNFGCVIASDTQFDSEPIEMRLGCGLRWVQGSTCYMGCSLLGDVAMRLHVFFEQQLWTDIGTVKLCLL